MRRVGDRGLRYSGALLIQVESIMTRQGWSHHSEGKSGPSRDRQMNLHKADRICTEPRGGAIWQPASRSIVQRALSVIRDAHTILLTYSKERNAQQEADRVSREQSRGSTQALRSQIRMSLSCAYMPTIEQVEGRVRTYSSPEINSYSQRSNSDSLAYS